MEKHKHVAVLYSTALHCTSRAFIGDRLLYRFAQVNSKAINAARARLSVSLSLVECRGGQLFVQARSVSGELLVLRKTASRCVTS